MISRAYTIIKERPLELKEKYASKCMFLLLFLSQSEHKALLFMLGVLAGAILVNQAAERYIIGTLY